MDIFYNRIIANFNYSLINLADDWFIEIIAAIIFTLSLIRFSPLGSQPDQSFHEIIFVKTRKILLSSLLILAIILFFSFLLYGASKESNLPSFKNWIIQLILDKGYMAILSWITGLMLRFIFYRYVSTFISSIKKKLRFQQKNDELSDIRKEVGKHEVKDFRPSKYYRKGQRFVGLDEKNKPQYINENLYRETHHQIIGPTRYGKGVLLGNLIDQTIDAQDSVIYIDPKADKFLPYIMYAAAKRNNKKFYFLSLRDGEPGKWQPFAGGNIRSALDRATQAFDLQESGSDADYYKTLEVEALTKALSQGRHLNAILKHVEHNEHAKKLKSKLKQWAAVDTFSNSIKNSFSIEIALVTGAIVYVRSDLQDKIVRTATKTFISEVISESRRLDPRRKDHLSFYIDEIKFLVSQEISDALAAAAGFRVNMTLAYQSLGDTLQPDDQRLNGKSLTDSININCQLKTIHGGAHPETAKYISEMSGKIYKQVTKLEHTEIKDAGAELWNEARTIGSQEERFIDENIYYALPKRACIQYIPSELTKIIFTSFVAVSDKTRKELDEYINTLYAPSSNAQDKVSQESKEVATENRTESGFIKLPPTFESKDNILDDLNFDEDDYENS